MSPAVPRKLAENLARNEASVSTPSCARRAATGLLGPCEKNDEEIMSNNLDFNEFITAIEELER